MGTEKMDRGLLGDLQGLAHEAGAIEVAREAVLTVLVVLFFAKMISKVAGVLPAVAAFRYTRQETTYYTLMMSTGLTFGTISARFG